MSRLAIGLVILVFMVGACSEGGPTKSPTRTQPPTFQLEWGVEGTGEGQFHEPEGIAVDAEGECVRGRFQQPSHPEVHV